MLLNGRDLVIVNPPWTLAGELAILLPALAKILGPKPGCRLDWPAGETATAGGHRAPFQANPVGV